MTWIYQNSWKIKFGIFKQCPRELKMREDVLQKLKPCVSGLKAAGLEENVFFPIFSGYICSNCIKKTRYSQSSVLLWWTNLLKNLIQTHSFGSKKFFFKQRIYSKCRTFCFLDSISFIDRDDLVLVNIKIHFSRFADSVVNMHLPFIII